MKNKVISKGTWARLFAIKNYQDFIQEWLALYDSFFAVNPKIEHKLEMDCMRKLFYGFGCKAFSKCNSYDDCLSFISDLESLFKLIKDKITSYE